ncbi:MAG: glycosyltransferase family 1 protein [Candidatus Gracilibacteria bacterium]|nr:glycosyltransferase family 1 protein [Candidatus Gracilibacteria bacterium]
MKIAIDIRTAAGEKTGKGWYTFHMVRNLLELDNQNEYILYSKDPVPGFEYSKNAEQRVVEGKSIFWHRKVAKDVVREKCDIFFAPTSFIIPSMLPKSVKSVIAIHDLVAFLFPDNHDKKAVLIEKLFLKRALKKATFVATISQNTKNDIQNLFGYDENMIDILYCGVGDEFKPLNKSFLEPFAKKTKLPAKFFLAVGTLEPRKNYTTLIEAFALVHAKYPDYHLIIVGGKGWKYEEIFETVRKNYLGKFVHNLGYVSSGSLVKLYNLAKGFVFPSFYEGFGIPPLEAMKSGCPVIASYSSSIPEVVGQSALLINPVSEIEIAAAMVKLIKDPELCEKLRNKGFLQSKKFSWKASAKKLLEIFRNI